MSARAAIRQADIQRAVRGAIAGARGTGKVVQVVIRGTDIIITPVEGSISHSNAADMERRMLEAFGE